MGECHVTQIDHCSAGMLQYHHLVALNLHSCTVRLDMYMYMYEYIFNTLKCQCVCAIETVLLFVSLTLAACCGPKSLSTSLLHNPWEKHERIPRVLYSSFRNQFSASTKVCCTVLIVPCCSVVKHVLR